MSKKPTDENAAGEPQESDDRGAVSEPRTQQEPRASDDSAPWGRRKDGTPKRKPGYPKGRRRKGLLARTMEKYLKVADRMTVDELDDQRKRDPDLFWSVLKKMLPSYRPPEPDQGDETQIRIVHVDNCPPPTPEQVALEQAKTERARLEAEQAERERAERAERYAETGDPACAPSADELLDMLERDPDLARKAQRRLEQREAERQAEAEKRALEAEDRRIRRRIWNDPDAWTEL